MGDNMNHKQLLALFLSLVIILSPTIISIENEKVVDVKAVNNNIDEITIESIIEKMTRRGHDLDMDRLKNYIYDIAGIRVICNYIDDIYQIIWLLAKQKDLKILVQKDYIVRPKSSGYRSFHIVFFLFFIFFNPIRHCSNLYQQ